MCVCMSTIVRFGTSFSLYCLSLPLLSQVVLICLPVAQRCLLPIIYYSFVLDIFAIFGKQEKDDHVHCWYFGIINAIINKEVELYMWMTSNHFHKSPTQFPFLLLLFALSSFASVSIRDNLL